jgi:hypothetical protein
MLDSVQRIREGPGAPVIELEESPVGPFARPALQEIADDAFVAAGNP